MTRVRCMIINCVNNLDGMCEAPEIEIDYYDGCLNMDKEPKHEPTPDKIHGMVE